MPIVATQAEAIDYVASEAVNRLGYVPGVVWRHCPVLTSNGGDHLVLIALAIFNDPLRRGVPEHCCIGLEAANEHVEPAFRLLGDSGAWAQIVVRQRDWFWKREPEAQADGPHAFEHLPEMLDRERPRLLPSAIMHQKRERQGYLFDRIFPITQRRLVQVFENAVQAGWSQLTDHQKRQRNALEKVCEAALRILCMQVFNHRDVLDRPADTVISGPRRPATTYQELIGRVGDLPDHLRGLRAYMMMKGRTGQFGLDTQAAIFQALSQNNEYDFACVTPDMLGPFYQAALMRDPASGDVDKERRKKYGIFYTSRRITQLILDRLPIEEIRPNDRFLLDPTCGSGSFLMAGEQRLTELVRPRRLPDAERAARASACVQGNDRDPFAVLVAKLQLVLDRPEAECQYRFKEVDIKFDHSGNACVDVPCEDRPSIIVGNPPFKRYGNVEERAALFLRAAVEEWLTDGGLLGFVLPATFLSGVGRCATIREAILESCEVLEAWDLPRNILSDEKGGNGGTNGGDIESCVVLLRKRKTSQDVAFFCRVLRVDRNSKARRLFRHRGAFTSHGLCVPTKDWRPLPRARWTASALAPALGRLYASGQCEAVRDVCQVINGIKRSPEEPVENVKSPPSPEHVPWLQTARGTRAFSLSVWRQGSTSDYIQYPGEMERPRLRLAKLDCNTAHELKRKEWRRRGLFAGRKILIHEGVDPASARPLRAFIDVGHYPSNNFHVAWLDPRLPEGRFWTYEALLAVLSGPVSQLCLALARTRTNPTDLIETIPIPRLDRESIDEISAEASAMLRIDADDDEARTESLKGLDRRLLALYPLSEWEMDLVWQTVWSCAEQEARPVWTDEPWPVHGVVETIRETDENGPATVRIRIPGFRRGAQIYKGPIPPEMPGWAMVEGIEFQAEVPWSDAEACRFDPLAVQRFRPLPFSYEKRRKRDRPKAQPGRKP